VEELGARVLPSATIPVPTAATTTARVATTALTTVAVPSLTTHGRFTATSPVSGTGKSYTFDGSVQFGNLGFFAVKGSIQTVGNIRSGQAHGRITLTSGRGTLTLDLTGPTQTSFAALPTKFNYKVVSGTGVFAHYAGQGTVQLSTQLFLGYSTRGHFDMLIRPTTRAA
jgi:hypothetical protein